MPDHALSTDKVERSAVQMENPCQYLNWDSGFFGFRIARVKTNRLRSEKVRAIKLWSDVHQIDCLYLLADADDEQTVRLAEDHGFRFADIRLTFEMKLEDNIERSSGDNESIIRSCRHSDIPGLRKIAETSFRFTRFYYDAHFPKELADAMYALWAEKSCRGYADAVIVAFLLGGIRGFITCHLLDRGHGQIGLVAVSAGWQGKGLAKQLINESLNWFSKNGVTQVDVVTQGRNYAAQRLYQQFGFRTKSVQIWYHKWF